MQGDVRSGNDPKFTEYFIVQYREIGNSWEKLHSITIIGDSAYL